MFYFIYVKKTGCRKMELVFENIIYIKTVKIELFPCNSKGE